jgi:serine phosphatase RsbU (regulator of sigma subunit)
MKLRYTFLPVLLLCVYSYVYSQAPDSLKAALKNAKHDTVRCRILNTMIEAEQDDAIWPAYNTQLKAICENNLKKYASSDPLYNFYLKNLAGAMNNDGYLAQFQGNIPEALKLYRESMAMEEKLGNKNGIATSLNNLGSIYQMQGNISAAFDCYKKSLALNIAINNKLMTAEAYNNLGLLYNDQGDISSAMNYYHKGLKLHEEIGNKNGAATTLNNLGALYNQQGDQALAASYYLKCIKIQEEINNKHALAGGLHNLAAIYKAQHNKPLALNYLNKSYSISEEADDPSGMAHCLNSIAAIYADSGNVGLALEKWNKSLELWEKLDDKQGIALVLNNMAAAAFKQKKIAEAQRYAERSLKLAQELGFPGNIRDASGTLSNIYSIEGDYKKAYKMLALYKHMSDSISNQTNRKALLRKSLQYEYDKKTAADSIKTVEERRVFEVQLKQQKTQRAALYVGIALSALFALFMYNRFRVTRNQKKIIELKEKEAIEQKNIIEEKHKEINDSINYAERIQRSFLASKEILHKHLKDYFILFKPKEKVSGDFYWAAELNDGNFAFVAADSTGHGVPGAIMSLLNITSLEKAVEHHTDPAEILNHTRKTIITRLQNDGSADGGKDGMDCSLMVFDSKELKLTIAAAQNPVWIIRQENGEAEFIETGYDKMPVGKHGQETRSFTRQTIALKKGDMVYAITDGFADQFGGPKGKKFMHKKLKELLVSISIEKSEKQMEILSATLNAWIGKLEQVDDITVAGIRI